MSKCYLPFRCPRRPYSEYSGPGALLPSKSYKAPWERWISWSFSYNVPLNCPSPQDVAMFLNYLHSQNFAYSTILVHKSVVVYFADPSRGARLSGQPLSNTY
uniref:Uncharacterized protein n=1 Tax=Cacopsylla melanoneura TaxID=428564 RepID=A0A8D8WYM0_9HEMI